MLTNPRDAFRGQSRSPNMVPFDMLGTVSITDDFRGIAISPVLAKTFEHCIIDRFASFFSTSPNQFGFKKRYWM